MKNKDHSFNSNIIQGPLAGVSSRPFRELVWQYSEPAYTCTEMISCKTILHDREFVNQRFINKSPLEKTLCVQLSANDPQELSESVKIVTDFGADIIDLNCGCPKKKIRSKNTGSKLLSDPQRLYHLIRAMKDNTHVPISIKIRVDSKSDENFNSEIAQVVQDAGADFLIVHGRHWKEQYETPCNYQEIQYFVESLDIPVIGNGDIACSETLQKMLNTGCDGVMIARAGVGQPWLPEQLLCEIKGEPFSKPKSQEIGRIFLTHIEKLIELLGSEKFAILHARKLAKYYAREMQEKATFLCSVKKAESFGELQSICERHF